MNFKESLGNLKKKIVEKLEQNYFIKHSRKDNYEGIVRFSRKFKKVSQKFLNIIIFGKIFKKFRWIRTECKKKKKMMKYV